MIKRKYTMIVALVACLTASLFVGITASVGEYDPWCDINDDGKIRIDDVLATALTFGSNGDPTKRVVIEGNNWTLYSYHVNIPARTVGYLNISTAGYKEVTLGFTSPNSINVSTGFLLGSRYVYVDKFYMDKSEALQPANTMWIEPAMVTLSTLTHPIGSRFNVTVWMNVNVTTSGWMFEMLYDSSYINATRAGYTHNQTHSDFFKNITTVGPIPPSFEPYHGIPRVTHGEAWLSGPFRSPGYGSGSWIEFEVIKHTPSGESYETTLDWGFDTYVELGPDRTYPELKGCLYAINWSLLEHNIVKTYTVTGPTLVIEYYNPNGIGVPLTIEAYVTV